jgi:hypothetical protein
MNEMKRAVFISLSFLLFSAGLHAQNGEPMTFIGAGQIYYNQQETNVKNAAKLSMDLGLDDAHRYFKKVPPNQNKANVMAGICVLSGLTYLSIAGWQEPGQNPQLSAISLSMCFGSLISSAVFHDRSKRLTQKGVEAFNSAYHSNEIVPRIALAEPDTLYSNTEKIPHTLIGGLVKGFVIFDGKYISLEEAANYARMYNMPETEKYLLKMKEFGYSPYFLNKLLGFDFGIIAEIKYYQNLSKAKKSVDEYNLGSIHNDL